ncbi:hypothetical protein V8G54_009617 [Vigna mungo]|uniref:NB-ARC domain-containing protein n=1 Tax=Vigna mungo TaxID=3915 RepID=A0AAQ3NUV5_VIGMU
MVSIVSDLAKSTLEKLINATLEESRYICCFTCITDDFEKERENLIGKKETWEEYARVATRRGDNIRKDVTHWQKQAKELIEEDTKMKVKCIFGWCPNCIWQYSRGKELESKTEKIKKLMECNFENVGITRDVPDIEYHSSQNYISFKSRKLKFEELFNALKDNNNYMIGLQGMGGIGKTTLAKEVGKELKKSKCFNQVIDTTISNSPYIKRIQDEIAGPLGLSFENCTESERARKLMGRLTNADKILLILDDVWGNISFGEIGIPFKDNHNNCKILVTTRYIRTCNKMGCEKIIQLDILTEEEGWILFQKYAGLSDNSSKSILYKGSKISKERKGLPIAIEIIASSLKGTLPLEEWDLALKPLQKSMHVPYDDESLRKIYTCLKYSYDNVKDETAKKLFLLCSMFRENEEISEELLVRLAKGATLIEKSDDDDSYDECRKKVIAFSNYGEHLQVNEPNANDVIAQYMSVELENMSLDDTSKILFTLQNVTVLSIERCEKVEVLFCASMLECLPYLGALSIFRCIELKQIIGEDAKNQRKPFFPRLKALIIRECNKLKCIFPISTSEMVPMLEALLIMEASMLEEVFEGNNDEKVEIPNLKTASFVELPSLRQKIEFLTVKHCLVRNCPKLYFSSFPQDLKHFSMTEYLKSEYVDGIISGALGNLNPEQNRYEEDSAIGTEVEAASFRGSDELTSSQNNANQSTLAKIDEDNQQHEEVVKESKERVEEEQQIVGKASSMPISPTDFPQHKTHSPVSFLF